MDKIEFSHNTRNLQEECLAWKKYFLLPTVLFDNNRQGRVKDDMREHVKLLASGDWSYLTLGSLQLKAPHRNLEISEADVRKKNDKTLESRTDFESLQSLDW